MIRLAIVLGLAVVASLTIWAILNATYAYDAFASDEARASLEVTEAQTAELLSSRRMSDALAFGIFGAVMGCVCGAVCNPSATTKSAAIAATNGLLLGGVAGTLGSFLAHWHDANVALPADPMFYWFVRWAAILIPIGLVSGFAGQLAGKSKTGADGILGGMIGAAVAALVYCLAAGSLTRLETHHNIFPAHSENRLLAFTAAAVCIAITASLQLSRKKKDPDMGPSVEDAESGVKT